jgi:TRAP-type mannitol/chloroaromatic compound transport system substrate-binding protein
MPNTYTLIASNTVGSGGASSVTFSSIPSTYTDLALRWSSRSTTTGVESAAQYMTFNGVNTNMAFKRLRGNGATADSYGESTPTLYGTADAAGATASTFSNGEIYIPNYAGTAYKSWSVDSVTENNATTAIAVFFAGLWSNTAAITSIGFTTDANFAQYSSFYLYGISKT